MVGIGLDSWNTAMYKSRKASAVMKLIFCRRAVAWTNSPWRLRFTLESVTNLPQNEYETVDYCPVRMLRRDAEHAWG